MSLHEPTIPDLLQAVAELKEREREAIRAHLLLEQENTIIRAHVTYLETELATLRARGS